MQNYYNLQISNKILKMNLPYYKNNVFFKKSNYISENDYTGLINILQDRHNVPILKRGWPWSAALE